MQNEKKKLLQWFTLRVLITGCLFIASVFVFALIADEVVLEHGKVVDDKIFSFFGSISTPAFINAMKVFTFLGSSSFLLPAYIVLTGYFFIQKKFRYGIEIAVIGLTSQGLLYTLKQIFHRQRPSLSLIKNITTYSFPSGHTFSSFIFCGILIYIVQHAKWKTVYKWILSTLLLLFALTIGMSRIVLKVHYPTDVIASLCLGIAWSILLFWSLKKMNSKYMNKYNAAALETKLV